MTQIPAKRLILIDGSSFLHRAYHAIQGLTNAEGMPTNAIYGVSNMLRKLLHDYQTEYFAVVFDAEGKNFRHDLYPDYKANRPSMPKELRVQVKPLYQLIQTLGLPLIVESGVEADDVLGALAQKAVAEGFEVIISTSDKDMAQLVCENIVLEDSMTGNRLDIQGVIEKFGVRPEQIADYLALVGDTADNIPGVPKVGAITAAKWLAEYQTLNNLIDHALKIKTQTGKSLINSLPQLNLSRQLTGLRCDLKLPYMMADLKIRPADEEALKLQLKALGFNAWLKQLGYDMAEEIKKNMPTNYATILTQEQLDIWLQRLNAAPLFAFDTETTSLNYSIAQIVGISFAIEIGTAAYLPLAHIDVNRVQQLNREQVLAQLKPLLENEHQLKVGQHLKYDAHVLANHGITLRGIAHDTMLESYVLNSTATLHNMEDLATHYLGLKTLSYQEMTGKGKKQISFAEVDIIQATAYAAEDADITLRLHETLLPQLQAIPSLEKLYQTLEMPLVPVLIRMEAAGVLIDSDKLMLQNAELIQQIYALEQQAHDLVGHVFNLGSPKQIQAIFYDELKLPVLKKTPKGQPSTDESVLQELALNYPLPRLILEHRSISKLKSTYTERLPEQINPKTGRIHTSYHQAVTATGRLSSSDPNLQNIPIRSAEGRKIRQAFIAPPGHKILAADYSQIELRIMAHLSQDEGLLKAFKNNEDVHLATAAEVFDIPLAQVTPELRRSAKAINFGLIYGMSAFGLAQQINVSREDAQSYINMYFRRYPGVKNYMDSRREFAQQHGYVETLLGRRLYIPDINAKTTSVRLYAERTAINAPMQGTAADIIKLAMLATDAWIQQAQPAVTMIMQVHDELVFEVREDQLGLATDKIRSLMSSALVLDVPLLVDIGWGDNWDEAH